MGKQFIVSTLTGDQAYSIFDKDSEGRQVPRLKRRIIINGGANVANKKTLITMGGAVTEVSDEDVEALMTVKSFQKHLKGEFVKILKKNPANVEKAASDLQGRDKSAPITDDDMKAEGKKSGSTKGKKDAE